MPELDAFQGEWTVSRAIEDAGAGHSAQFHGTARLWPDGPGLRYREAGTLHLPGQPEMAATRDYLWRRARRGIAVLFDDGRPFHVIGPGPTPQASHACDPDMYHVSYDFRHWPEWRAIWRAVGPNKDYVMQSHYCRRGN